jgi:hypothetical protein
MASESVGSEPNNPTGFKRPFLTLGFAEGGIWEVDVDSQVGLYIARYSETDQLYKAARARLGRKVRELGFPGSLGAPYNWRTQVTPLLEELAEGLMQRGQRVVDHVGIYDGIAFPTHMLRGGCFFQAVDLTSRERSGMFNSIDITPFLPIIHATKQ